MEDPAVLDKLGLAESTPLIRSPSLSRGGGLGGSEAEKAKDISAIREHDGKGLVEWSWQESICFDDSCCLSVDNENGSAKNRFLSAFLVCSSSPFILMAFSVTILGKIVHDVYDQGMPLHRFETPWERKVRVQGILTTTGLQLIIICFSIVILVRRYFQFRIEGTFDDIATVYLRTLVTVASSVNVIFSNIIFLNAMRSKWQQAINLFIIGSYFIVLSQIAMGCFDTWILVTGEYTFTDVLFCVLHFAETLYSAIQCILYQTMWNFYTKDRKSNPASPPFAQQHQQQQQQQQQKLQQQQQEQQPQEQHQDSADEGELVASTNIVMLAFVNWASLLISFRFTSISDFLVKNGEI